MVEKWRWNNIGMLQHSIILPFFLLLIFVGCMKTENQKTTPLLLEGELLLENTRRMVRAEVKVSILDITHIDAKSQVLTESIEVLTIKENQTHIPFKVFGPVPDPLKSYIVVAYLSAENEMGGKKTIHRTTQSIPVFREGYPEVVKVPLTKID